MKKTIVAIAFGALALTAATVASARVNVNFDIAPFGYAPPPVVYQPAPVVVARPYYEPAPVVYYGGGNWGDDHRRWHHEHYRGREWHR